MSEAARRLESGVLDVGALRFPIRMSGPAAGPLVLCVHGFPDDPSAFDALLPALGAAGYRAVAPTLRGYAPSCQPADGDHRLWTVAADVTGWLDALGAQRAHLFGHDWGAVACYAAAQRAPGRVASLATLAVPHLPPALGALARMPAQWRKSWYQLFFQLPGLPERTIRRADFAFLRALARRWSPGFDFTDAQWARRRATFAQPGVVEGALGWYRQIISPRALARWRDPDDPSRRPIRAPTLALTGALDGCIDTRLYDACFAAADFPGGATVERIDGVGHFAHLEAPAVIATRLLDWLATHS